MAILDPATLAREIGLDYLGSVENQLLPAAWIQSAIDAHRKLGIEPAGYHYAALDPADQKAAGSLWPPAAIVVSTCSILEA